MRVRWLGLLVAGALTAACSSGNPEVETGPDPDATVIPGTGGDAAGEPARKNENASENASTAAKFGIPPGHLPPPGQCKVWIPGEPPGQQKKKYKAGDCGTVSRQVPAGGWLVYRPGEDKKEVVVREYGSAGDVISISIFDIVTGALLRQEDPEG
ncbi:MAG: hypothetical protein ACYS1C_10280 [Planctomycetota bacterium]|jgi:hypothetical protein